MCRMETPLTTRPANSAMTRIATRLIVGVALCAEIAAAQTTTAPVARAASPWRKLGNSAVAMNLAGPAGGPVAATWFSFNGDRIFVRTRSGQIFEATQASDFSNWTRTTAPNTPQPLEQSFFESTRGSEPGARIVLVGSRVFSLGANLSVSEDSGQTWTNLTANRHESVIGTGQRSVAVSPTDARVIVVANDYGLWRTADGGRSWTSLNEELPNLPVRHLLTPGSQGALRAEIENLGAVELPPASAAAHTDWIKEPVPQADDAPRQQAAARLGAPITAFARTATTWFAGSIDGRLWTSSDNGANWTLSTQKMSGRIEALQPGGDTPAEGSRSALAVVGAMNGGARLLRTTNAGGFWEDIGTQLPEGALHGVAVDAAAGVAYVAGDRGVFSARVDIVNMTPVSAWQQLAGLPDGPAEDVRLDLVRNHLYVAVDGYGVYVAPAPHRGTGVRVMTAADQPAQSAAPGLLLHVQGSGVSRVHAEEGSEVALVSSSEGATQFQVPFEAVGSSLALTVDSQQGQSRVSLPMRSVAPSILVDSDGYPILVNAATGLTLDARNVARAGGRIQIFAAGLGKVNPEWRTGVPAPEDAPVVVAKVEARLDGNPVEVTKATLAPGYVGLYLVEVQLPGLVNAGSADLSLVINGETSNHVRILLSVE